MCKLWENLAVYRWKRTVRDISRKKSVDESSILLACKWDWLCFTALDDLSLGYLRDCSRLKSWNY